MHFPGFLSQLDRILASSILLRWSLTNQRIFIKVNFHVVVDMEQGESKPLSRFQLGKLKLFIMKNLTDFCKMVKTGVDPCLPASSQGRTWTQSVQVTSPVLNHLACHLQCLVCFLWVYGFLYTAVLIMQVLML